MSQLTSNTPVLQQDKAMRLSPCLQRKEVGLAQALRLKGRGAPTKNHTISTAMHDLC